MSELNQSGDRRRNSLDDIDDTPRTDLTDESLELWPRMFRDRATDLHWSGYYDKYGRNDILDLLDVIATLKAKMTAMEAEYKAGMQRAIDDAFRQAEATQKFIDEQTQRVIVLEKCIAAVTRVCEKARNSGQIGQILVADQIEESLLKANGTR
jgi:hypothetical protein